MNKMGLRACFAGIEMEQNAHIATLTEWTAMEATSIRDVLSVGWVKTECCVLLV